MRRPLLRRPLIRLLIASVLVVVLAGAAARLLALRAPGFVHARAEAGLSEALGTRVSIETAELRIWPRLRFQAQGVRAWEGQDGPALEVAWVDAGIAALPLLLGQLRIDRLVLEGATLHLERSAEGRWSPFSPPEMLGFDESRPRPARVEWSAAGEAARWLDAIVDDATRLRAPPLTLALRGASLHIVDRSRTAARAGLGVIAVDPLDLQLTPWALGRGLRVEVDGSLQSGGRSLGRIAVALRREPSRAASLTANLAELDLSLLALRGAGRGGDVRGHASGGLELASSDGVAWRLTVDLALPDLEARSPDPSAAPRALPPLKLRGTLTGDHTQLELPEIDIRIAGRRATISGELARPITASAVAGLRVEAQSIETSDALELVGALPRSLRERVPGLGRIRGGRIVALEASGRATLARWLELLVTGPRDDREAFLLRANVSGVGFELAEDDRLEIDGQVAWTGYGLELRGVRATRGGEALPELDATLTGLPHLLRGDARSRVRPPPVGALRGLEALRRIVLRPRDEDEEEQRGPTWVTIDADWVHHPALLYPFEQLLLTIERGEQGVSFALDSGVWGGVPVSGDGRYERRPEPHIVIDLAAHPPVTRPVAWKPVRYWARGIFECDGFALGPWQIRAARGEFHTEGQALHLTGIDALSGPTLRQHGFLELGLREPDAVPLRTHFRIENGALPELAAALLLDADHVSGTADVEGDLTGSLHPDRHPLSDLVGRVRFRARDGKIRRELPAVFAISRASDTNLLSSRDEVRFERIDGDLELRDGRVHLASFDIDSPDLRVLASGNVDLVDPEHPVEAVVGVLFFRGLDATLDRIPLLRDLILGHDKNLLCAYFQLTGPWQAPAAKLITTKSLAEGPVRFVAVVPGFVRRGIDAIQSVVLPRRDDAESPPAGARGS